MALPHIGTSLQLYTGWQDVISSFLPTPAVLAANAEQGNLDILQHLRSDRRDGASNKLFLNRPIQFYLNNDHRLPWRHFTPSTVGVGRRIPQDRWRRDDCLPGWRWALPCVDQATRRMAGPAATPRQRISISPHKQCPFRSLSPFTTGKGHGFC